MEALPRRNSTRKAFWKGFGLSRTWILKSFLKSPLDGMMCLRKKNGKARIFGYTSVFTVRLNMDVVEDSRGPTGKGMSFELGSWKPSRNVFGPPWNLDLDDSWV